MLTEADTRPGAYGYRETYGNRCHCPDCLLLGIVKGWYQPMTDADLDLLRGQDERCASCGQEIYPPLLST